MINDPSEVADILLRDLGSVDAALKYAARIAASAEWNGNLDLMRVYDQAAALILARANES